MDEPNTSDTIIVFVQAWYVACHAIENQRLPNLLKCFIISMLANIHPEIALVRFVLTLGCYSMQKEHHDSDLEIFAVLIPELLQFVFFDIVEDLMNFGVRNAIPSLVESDHIVKPGDLVAKFMVVVFHPLHHVFVLLFVFNLLPDSPLVFLKYTNSI